MFNPTSVQVIPSNILEPNPSHTAANDQVYRSWPPIKMTRLFPLSFFVSPLLSSFQAMATFYLTLNPASFLAVSSQKRLSSNSIQCCQDTNGQPRPRVTHEPSDNWLTSFPEKNPIISSPTVLPPRPRRIILVRHGQSEGNVDESVYTQVPDPKIKLTEKGMAQAEECGKNIRKMIEKDWCG
ncbi:Phosphoglycerate mutase-like protein AT74 [Vitis vinifera]|uniref:Phosphoglycerate mutase-like protein AT74 n=1 Tax=Vitis vinifera TaxID=29760 RepID=A0A438E646_VITVI|nr:Phosphoglycerate mutase-like protein AT74 [Vitis vinifera]